MTLGKMYIWKNFANILASSDTVFDKFFFRAFGTVNPTCTGVIPCKFCVVGYPVPSA